MDSINKRKSRYVKKPKLYKAKLTELYEKVKRGENIDCLLKKKNDK